MAICPKCKNKLALKSFLGVKLKCTNCSALLKPIMKSMSVRVYLIGIGLIAGLNVIVPIIPSGVVKIFIFFLAVCFITVVAYSYMDFELKD